MREALARSDLDFTVVDDERDDRRDGQVTRLPKILRIASIGTACVMGGVILVNALYMQDRKHPAPLLRAPEPPPVAEAVQTPLPAPRIVSTIAASPALAPASKPTGRDAIGDEIKRMSSATAAPERKEISKPAPIAPEKSQGDAIASLIGGSSTPAQDVLAAQKALVRLGYVLRADGVAGATTKQAIEQYEKDNKRPVRGELTPKLAKELAQRTAAR